MNIVNIRIGEILKLKKTDRFPSLEITVEMENNKVKPQIHFFYLYDTSTEMREVLEEFRYKVEKLEIAENIGKTYILLDFDKTKK